MNSSPTSRRLQSETKLMVLGRGGEISHARMSELPRFLKEGDLLVANDAATLPASLAGRYQGIPIELRLAQATEPYRKWVAVVLGEGDWRTPTEERTPPPQLEVGARLELGGLGAKVLKAEGRLLEIEFSGEDWEILHGIYLLGRPVQYSYLNESLEIWDQQTLFSSRPIAVEPPSASFPLTWDLLSRLEKGGVQWVTLTHSAGLSSTGDARIDSQLPLAERYWIPDRSAQMIRQVLSENRRVIALGSTVTRALEDCAHQNGRVVAGAGIARLKLDPATRLRVVSGILTGIHEAGSSHLRMLGAFADQALLTQGYREAEALGYLQHEYGDSCLIVAR